MGAGGQETLLLVDDDEGARELLGLHLRRVGFRVLEAADGIEALEVAEKHEGHIDLVISDVQMPRLDGLELVKRLRVLRPHIQVLLMSGNPDHIRFAERPTRRVFPKSGFESLTRAVRASLETR